MPLYSVYVFTDKSWLFGELLCDLWLSLDYTACLCSIYTNPLTSLLDVAITGIRVLSVFHLHRLLYHRRPLLLHTHASAVQGVANRTKGQSLNIRVLYTIRNANAHCITVILSFYCIVLYCIIVYHT